MIAPCSDTFDTERLLHTQNVEQQPTHDHIKKYDTLRSNDDTNLDPLPLLLIHRQLIQNYVIEKKQCGSCTKDKFRYHISCEKL